MADEADQAQLFEERERDAQVAAVVADLSAPRLRGDDGFCGACGDSIEPERLAVMPHAVRCLCCQEQREQLRRLFRS